MFNKVSIKMNFNDILLTIFFEINFSDTLLIILVKRNLSIKYLLE